MVHEFRGYANNRVHDSQEVLLSAAFWACPATSAVFFVVSIQGARWGCGWLETPGLSQVKKREQF